MSCRIVIHQKSIEYATFYLIRASEKKHIDNIRRAVTEKQLIERCAKHDREAQQMLYEKYASKMFGICFRYIPNKEQAQDVLHDGFITVFMKIGGFRHEGSFEGWLRRVFVTTALGYLRRSKKIDEESVQAETVVNLSSENASALEGMEVKELLGVISGLPAGYRTVLNLYAIEGYSHKEIAGQLGITEGTSRSQLLRAKAMLLKIIEKEKK